MGCGSTIRGLEATSAMGKERRERPDPGPDGGEDLVFQLRHRGRAEEEDLRGEYQLGRLADGHRGGMRRVRAAIRKSKAEPRLRRQEAIDAAAGGRPPAGENYHLDPRNEAVHAALELLP